MALYPPVVASSMPAFSGNTVRVYFTLSSYNSSKRQEIKKVHLTVRRQSSNVSVLKGYEIVEKDIEQNQEDKAFHRYFITINSGEIEGGFKVDVLYKVQLRFSSIVKTASDPTISFFTNNLQNFSEWSTVCIIKQITPPQFYIDDFHVQGEQPKEDDINNFNYNLADFVGIYKQGDSSQTLKQWRIRLLSSSYTRELESDIDNYTLADSGYKATSAYNYTLDDQSMVLECSLPYQLIDNTSYKLLFEIQTKNDYTSNILYTFNYSPQAISALTGVLSTAINEEQGYIKLTYTSSESYIGNLVIRRSDSKGNFLNWEDLKNFQSYNEGNFEYYDFTAESGMAYRYLIQKRDSRGRRGTPLYSQSYTIAEWEHAFLLQVTGNGDVDQAKQLKLKFDFQISSYTTNIAESRTDTIGSKYPYIRRNGNMYYRSFPCSGTITEFMDTSELFTTQQELYDNYVNTYKEFRGQMGDYVEIYDYTHERKFREKVQEFLYNVKPKLYKSMQEGNIFIKLMDVSLTPKNQLGRLVYSFSATAYEIDQATLATLNNYGLLDIGEYNPNIYYEKTKIGQVSSFKSDQEPSGNLFKAGQDIIGAGIAAAANSIAAKNNYNVTLNGQKVTDFTLTWLRLEVESQPYLIKQVNGVFYPVDDVDSPRTPTNKSDPLNKTRSTLSTFVDKNYVTTSNSVENIGNAAFDIYSGDINYKLYQMQSTYESDNIYLGTLFNINGEQVIIAPPNNIYELKGDQVSFSTGLTIIPYKDTAMTVDYIINLHIEEDSSSTPKKIRTDAVNGQLIGTYSKSDELISRINYKYRYNYAQDTDNVVRYVNGVNTISVDTQPGAVVYLRTTAQQTTDSALRFVINETGQLFFDPCDATVYINRLYITGMNIPIGQITNRGTFSSLDDVYSPIDKDMCMVEGVTYLYYKNNWYQGTLQDNNSSYDIECPVDALIFYYASIRRDFY